MLFQEPRNTPYDLCFSVAGIPVRVHPLFWVVGIIMGASAGSVTGIALWTGAIFVSILIHELGHAVVMRWYGEVPRISLYFGGGLAISGGDKVSWGNKGKFERTTSEQIIISFAGPAAGFILAGLIIGLVYLNGGKLIIPEGRYLPQPAFPFNIDEKLWYLIFYLLLINTFWGLVNLVPVYPLDGGQISRAVFTHVNPSDGIRQSLWVSVFAGALVAFAGVVLFRQPFITILFALLAFSSFQSLQMIDRGGFGGGNPW